MPRPREEWLAARAAARQQMAAPAIESCELRSRPDGRFDVILRGQHLHSGAIPPQISIGDRRATEIRMERDESLRAVIDGGREGDDVTVVLGPLGEATGTVGSVT